MFPEASVTPVHTIGAGGFCMLPRKGIQEKVEAWESIYPYPMRTNDKGSIQRGADRLDSATAASRADRGPDHPRAQHQRGHDLQLETEVRRLDRQRVDVAVRASVYFHSLRWPTLRL